MLQIEKRHLLTIISILLTLVILGVTARYISLYHFNAPQGDSWDREVPLALSIYAGTFHPADVMVFHDVHLVAFPLALSALNAALNPSWQIEGGIGIGIVLLVVSYLMVLDMIRRSSPHLLPYAMPVIALLMFSLRQHTNLIWSFGALVWFSQIFFVVAVAWGLAIFSLEKWWTWGWLVAMVLGAVFSSAVGLVLLIALMPVFLAQKIKWHYFAAWMLFSVTTFGLYLSRVPSSNATQFSLSERAINISTSFISVNSSFFLPQPWQTPPWLYVVIFVGASGWLAWIITNRLITNEVKPALPWLFLCLYGLGASALVVLGRAATQWGSVETRYASIVVLFWVGLVGLAFSTIGILNSPDKRATYLSRISVVAIFIIVLLQIRVNWLAFTVDRRPGAIGYYNGILAEQCLWSFFVSRGESCVNQYENIGMGAIRPMLVDIQSRQLTAFADYDGYNPATTHMPSVFQHDDKIIISGQTPLQHIVNLTYEDRFGHIQSIPPAQIFRIVDEDASTALTPHASHVAVSNTDPDMEPLTEFVRLEERVWYLRGYDETDFDRAYLDLLEENFTPAPIAGGRFNTTVYEDITLFTRKPSPQIQFEELAAIDAWRLSTPYTISPCDPVVIEMLWYSLADLDTTYSLALLLVDEETGQPALRIQGAPGGYETQLWAKYTFYPATEQFAGTCGLEPDTSLLLLMGLYPAGDPDAIPATYPDGTPIGDLVYLTTLHVSP